MVGVAVLYKSLLGIEICKRLLRLRVTNLSDSTSVVPLLSTPALLDSLAVERKSIPAPLHTAIP